MNNLADVSGKRVLVTGASAGIGRQTAITLSALGAKVTLVGRNEQTLAETLSLLAGDGNRSYVADLGEIETIEPLVKRMVASDGAFDGLAHCAGISYIMPLPMFQHRILHEMMRVNFYAFFELVRVLTKKGRFNPGMSIVGVSSTAAVCGSVAQSGYSASKAAMEGAVRSMAKELADKQIRVNCVRPGLIHTAKYDHWLLALGENLAPVEENLRRQYLGMGEPEDVAALIAFLLSDTAKFITGAQYSVDGGVTSC